MTSATGKAVVLLSGGPDSATVAYSAKNQGYELVGLHLFQGHQHSNHELTAAREVSEALDIRLDVINVAAAVAACGGRVFTIHSEAAILPYGTAIVVSLASAYAMQAGASSIMLAVHADDAAEGPEFSREFFDAMERTVKIATDKDFKVLTPVLSEHKPDVLRMGRDLGVPFELTWSCIGTESQHCGLCGACHARQRGFALAGIPDPTAYATPVTAGQAAS